MVWEGDGFPMAEHVSTILSPTSTYRVGVVESTVGVRASGERERGGVLVGGMLE